MSFSAPQPQTVSELTRELRELVEANFDQVVCIGEVSNLIQARSGHIYFTLKDDQSQISGVMWKTKAQRLSFQMQDGLQIVVAGRIEIYPPRGSYQLIVDQAFPQGIGPLELAFRQLQEKLAAEGLFESARKRPLPRLPQKIALVTSPTGAAVRDMLQVLTRRWPLTDLVIVPVPVQGPTAAPLIAAGLAAAAKIPGVDLIITGRGGGSLEDLWPFNEEVVARAIVKCPVPVVSAVGHEIDVSIADLVADHRALTPTEAAETVVPSKQDVLAALHEQQARLQKSLRMQSQQARRVLEIISRRRVLVSPQELLTRPRRLVDELEQRLVQKGKQILQQARQKVELNAAQLEALSPLRVLARGYTITRRENGEVIRKQGELEVNDLIKTSWEDGTVVSRIEQIQRS